MDATHASLHAIPPTAGLHAAGPAPAPLAAALPGFGWFLVIPISFSMTLAAVIWVATHAAR